MTPRERMLRTLSYSDPDRLPVFCYASPAGLYRHGMPLLERLRSLPPDNLCHLAGLAAPPEGTVDSEGRYYERKRDDWGTTWEYRVFGIHGHPAEYPLASWREGLEGYAFPTLPSRSSRQWAARQAQNRHDAQTHLIFAGWVSLFEKLHALRPFEEVLMDLACQEPDLLAFLDRLEAYWQEAIDLELDAGADVITFGDDWGTQTAPIVATGLFEEWYAPRYRRLIDRVHARGKRVLFHSCGLLGEILPRLLDLGIDALWPQIGRYDYTQLTDLLASRKVTLLIHPDRQQLIPLGTPEQIDQAIQAYARRHHELHGGGMFYVEIENDAPWENVEAFLSAMERYR